MLLDGGTPFCFSLGREQTAMTYDPASIVPYSQDAEEAALGAVLINPESYFAIASFLRPEDFFILRHQYIWEAMTRLAERNETIDLLTVREELRAQSRLNDIGGAGYLTQLTLNVPTSVHAEVYGRLVERAAVRRRLLTAADEIRGLAMDETLSLDKVVGDAEGKLFQVTERNLRRDMVPMREAISEYFDRLEHLMAHPDEPLGLPTGFRDLDTILGGLQRSDLLIFAGRPGMGKCVTGDTLIPTQHGLIPIEQLKPQGAGEGFTPLEIGVQTPYGMRMTSHFYDSGIKPTLRVTTTSGVALDGTHIHPVLTLEPDGSRVWTPMSLIQPGDQIAIERTAGSAADRPSFKWDQAAAVYDLGLQHCYDLTIPDGSSFVSNGIVSHNTSFLLSVALNAAKLGGRILIFTMEMGADQIVQRLVSMETGINTQKLRLGQLSQQEWARFVQASGKLGSLPIFIDDTPSMTPLQIRTKSRRIAHEYGLDLVIIDYLQLMTAGTGYENNRVQEISYISRNLKEMARELNVPVFSAAQLSRAVESRQDKRPQLSDLRESGSIEQDSDIVIFLYRDAIYNEATEFPNMAEVIISKHRNGPTGTINLHFEKSLTKFSDARTQTIDLSSL